MTSACYREMWLYIKSVGCHEEKNGMDNVTWKKLLYLGDKTQMVSHCQFWLQYLQFKYFEWIIIFWQFSYLSLSSVGLICIKDSNLAMTVPTDVLAFYVARPSVGTVSWLPSQTEVRHVFSLNFLGLPCLLGDCMIWFKMIKSCWIFQNFRCWITLASIRMPDFQFLVFPGHLQVWYSDMVTRTLYYLKVIFNCLQCMIVCNCCEPRYIYRLSEAVWNITDF